ncbi:MAG: phosphate ABC transporter substrate-binding protein [Coleofasciculaceae cyanobacterium]
MSQKNESAVLILALIITAALLGGGFWWFTRSGLNIGGTTQGDGNSSPAQTPQGSKPNQTTTPIETFALPSNVPAGTTVKIAGSTSMVQINQALKNSFERQFPGTVVNTQAGGTDQGVQSLLGKTVDLAAISRPLSSSEQSKGLVVVPVTKDAIAIVVGKDNTFRKGLTSAQVADIFQGKMTNWSQVGGEAGTIQVINRPAFSGTHQAFQELALKNAAFGTTPNITTLQQDVTTPLLQKLGTNGIGYATFAQVANQQTVRVVAVDGLTPEAANYPYQRGLYYAYQSPASPQVQAFLGYAISPQGQQIIAETSK